MAHRAGMVRTDDDHGARRVPRDGGADRPEQEAPDGTATARSDDHHLCPASGREQCLARIGSHDGLVHVDGGVPFHDALGRSAEDGLAACAHLGHEPVGLREPDGPRCAEAPDRVHEDERATLACGFVSRPVHGAGAGLRAVDADDDAALRDAGGVHESTIDARARGRYRRTALVDRDLVPARDGQVTSTSSIGRRGVRGRLLRPISCHPIRSRA